MTRVETSFMLREEKAVSGSAFAGYFAGCLEMCFGINTQAILTLLLLKLLYSHRFVVKKSHISFNKSAQILSFIIGFGLMFSMVPAVVSNYMEKKTSGRIVVKGQLQKPKFMLCGNWLNETAMQQHLSLPDDVWLTDDDDWNVDVQNQPSMCSIVASVIGGNPNFKSWGMTGIEPAALATVRKYKDILTQALTSQKLSLEDLIAKIVYDGSHLVFNITNYRSEKMEYTIKPVLAGAGGICHEIEIDYDSLSTFGRDDGPVVMQVSRYPQPVDNFKCEPYEDYGLGRKILFVEEDFTGYPQMDFHFLASRYDHHLKMSINRIAQKSSNRKPCVQGSGGGQVCVNQCVQRHTGCKKCQVFMPGWEMFEVYNVSKLCDRFVGMLDNCFLTQALTEQDIAKDCSAECPESCNRVMYTMRRDWSPPQSESVQKLFLHIDHQETDSFMEEFYTYDISLVFCTVAGIMGLCLGVSFISVVKSVIMMSKLITRKGAKSSRTP